MGYIIWYTIKSNVGNVNRFLIWDDKVIDSQNIYVEDRDENAENYFKDISTSLSVQYKQVSSFLCTQTHK